jgi:hypothetical protein
MKGDLVIIKGTNLQDAYIGNVSVNGAANLQLLSFSLLA